MLGATCRSHGAQKIVDFAWQRWEICRWHMKDDAYVCIYVINVIRSGWIWSHHFHPRTCTAAVFQVGDSFHFGPGSGTTRWVMPRSQRDLAPCPEGRAGLLSDLFVSYCCSFSVHTLQMFWAYLTCFGLWLWQLSWGPQWYKSQLRIATAYLGQGHVGSPGPNPGGVDDQWCWCERCQPWWWCWWWWGGGG